MADNKVFTGAIALIKVKGKVIGKMKTIRCQESMRRQPVVGLGTIIPSDAPVTGWSGTLSCEFMEVRFEESGITDGIKRKFSSPKSQVLTGGESFEDQLVLDSEGVQVDIFKKITDIIDPVTGIIKPKAVPYVTVLNCLIESDSFDISEGGIAGHSQTFQYLLPITMTP